VLGHDRIKDKIQVSEQTQEVLNGFQAAITKAVAAAVRRCAAQRALRAGGHRDEGRDQPYRRLGSHSRGSPAGRRRAQPHPAYTLEVEIIEKQKRIYYFAKRMAKTVLPAVLQGQ
jgi:phosphate:Na+ symporter